MGIKAIVVVERSQTRLQLKRFLADLKEPQFSVVKTAECLVEGLERLRDHAPVSLAIVSSNYAQDKLASFMEHARAAAPSATFVLLARESAPDRQAISSAMVLGFHAVIREPFCLANIEQVAQLMPALKKTQTAQRLRVATGLLLSAFLRESGETPENCASHGNLFAEAEDCCRRFKEATGESVTTAVVEKLKAEPISARAAHCESVCRRLRELFSGKVLPSTQLFSHFRLMSKS